MTQNYHAGNNLSYAELRAAGFVLVRNGKHLNVWRMDHARLVLPREVQMPVEVSVLKAEAERANGLVPPLKKMKRYDQCPHK